MATSKVKQMLCPLCKSPLVWTKAGLQCTNKKCEEW